MKRRTLIIMGTGAAIGAVASLIIHRPRSAAELRDKMPLAARIKLCLDLAKMKLATTIDYLDSYARRGILYPYLTHPEPSGFNFFNWLRRRNSPTPGTWKLENADFWAAGAFPALLWKITDLESDPMYAGFWAAAAKKWSDPLKEASLKNKDIALNNLLVFAPWVESGQGKGLEQAIREAGEVRFLPIILTSLTAIGGLLPIAWSSNPLISPLAIVLIGGLISSTLLSRVVTPVVYKLIPPRVKSAENQS